MSQSWIEFWNCILNLTQNNLSWLFKSTVKIWVKLNIRNLVKNYPVLQVRRWICGGQGSWLVLKSFSLGQVSLLWKFELNWMSGCWEKFVWAQAEIWWVGGMAEYVESLQVLSTLDFGLGLWQLQYHYEPCPIIFYIVRRMFPTVRISFRNVPDLGKFLVLLDIIPCDNKRYRYKLLQWYKL